MQNLVKVLMPLFVLSYLIGCSSYPDSTRTTIDTVNLEEYKKQQVIKAYYYGDPHLLNLIAPKLYTKLDLNGNTIYQERVVRAFLDKRVALLYTANNFPGLSFGVNLSNCKSASDPVEITLFGGMDKEDAINQLFGKEEEVRGSLGYIYTISPNYFDMELGLGCKEAVSHKPINAWEVEKINKRKILNEYIKNGLITLDWFASQK